MLGLGGAMEPLAGGRSWPDSPEEALAILIVIVCAWAIGAGLVALAGRFLWWWCFTNRPNAYRQRLEKGSAGFRARWPREQLGSAPYVELTQEAQRCWAMILMAEELDNSAECAPDAEGLSMDIAELRHWVELVVLALNSAADRERRVAVGGYF
ncbi:hypothetical protein [Mycolicibacterium sp. HK-90]|uniref:hypothetical protein n=1 Tax=Mycolicibacterium sp. HK-90 TaxID=3056937 RepID=UPI00265A78E7|nr:hypothetical protein [Mycolicibacterium sp. HK-90]WKG04251.1 hypothetical protein QU592_03790 [Mycolicibacterium sp. HK-90]